MSGQGQERPRRVLRGWGCGTDGTWGVRREHRPPLNISFITPFFPALPFSL